MVLLEATTTLMGKFSVTMLSVGIKSDTHWSQSLRIEGVGLGMTDYMNGHIL